MELEEYKELSNGARLSILCYKEMDSIVYMDKGNSCHVYTGDTESGADMEVVLYDNLRLEVYGWRKNKPRIVLKDDEFPCTLELDFSDNSNITVSTKPSEEK